MPDDTQLDLNPIIIEIKGQKYIARWTEAALRLAEASKVPETENLPKQGAHNA